MNELKADAERRLPLGSSREQAQQWFASHGITDVQEARDLAGTGYKATIPNSSWMEGGEIIVTCMFDRENRLDRLTVVRMRVRKDGDGGQKEPFLPEKSQPQSKPGREMETGR